MSNEEKERVVLTLRIPKELHASVKLSAKDKGVSVNSYIVQALSLAVEKVDVPLSAVIDDGRSTYVLAIPPEWYTDPREEN